MFDLVWVMSRSWCFLITFRTPFFGLSLWWFFTYFDLFGFWIIIQSPNASFGSSQLVSHFGEGWNMAILKPAGTSRHADSNTEDFRWGGSLCLHQRVNEAADLLHRSSTLLRLWALDMELLRNLCLDRQALPPLTGLYAVWRGRHQLSQVQVARQILGVREDQALTHRSWFHHGSFWGDFARWIFSSLQ